MAQVSPPTVTTEMQTWASGIGLPVSIAQEYVGENGSIPANLSIDALNSWGTSTGRRDSSGNWHALGYITTSGASSTPSTNMPILSSSNFDMSKVTNWIEANPVLTGVGAIALVMLLGGGFGGGRSSRRRW
jgi:hypothetical protein